MPTYFFQLGGLSNIFLVNVTSPVGTKKQIIDKYQQGRSIDLIEI